MRILPVGKIGILIRPRREQADEWYDALLEHINNNEKILAALGDAVKEAAGRGGFEVDVEVKYVEK